METKIENWREKELSIEEVFAKYPEIPKIVILKTDVHRRGYILSEKAQVLFNKGDYQSQADTIFGKKEGENKIPIGLVFRDGTSLVGGYYTNYGIRDPYVIDDIDGKFVLTDNGKVYEEVEFWREPDFYKKKTSKGTPMGEVVNVRPQRLNVAISRVCHFWDKPGEGCKYCNVGINGIDSVKKGIPDLFDYDEVAEAVAEAVKQKGRFAMIMVTTGSILTGEKVFDDEVDEIIKAFEKIALEPGEEKDLSFTLDKRAFAYWNTELHDWYVESGEFTIEIGRSSRDIVLRAPVTVRSTVPLSRRYDMNSIFMDILADPRAWAAFQPLLAGLRSVLAPESDEGASDAAREAISEEMGLAMLRYMPLRGLLSFGNGEADPALLERILAELNKA